MTYRNAKNPKYWSDHFAPPSKKATKVSRCGACLQGKIMIVTAGDTGGKRPYRLYRVRCCGCFHEGPAFAQQVDAIRVWNEREAVKVITRTLEGDERREEFMVPLLGALG